MIRRFLVLLMAFSLGACTPELIPRPVTPGPSVPPATKTAVPINAPVITSPALARIAMLDENNGWGISDTAVLRTTDGGSTWYNLSPQNPGQLGYFVASSFLDTQHGWILVPDASDMLKGTLFSSSDGGATWNHVAVPFGGGDLHFLDAKHGWMIASLGAGAGSMAVAVLQTTDGGQTWTQTYTNDPNQPNAGASLPLGGLKDGLSPVNMETAWIGGVTYAPGVIYLYQTKDAGATWVQSTIKVPDGYDQAQFETRGPIFVGANTAYLPATVSSQNGVMLAVYVSHDGGASWLETPIMIPQGGATDFVSARDGFIWNGSSFYVTHDGAQTWKSIQPDVSFSEAFSSMDFVSPTTGFVVTSDASGAHGLYKTTNGGVNWIALGK
ncbi:MAG TPA: hypothetical protein VF784_09730 [Anaerolineales bacterium]